MISLDLQAKRFGETEVLGPMSIRFNPGERVAVTGPSGVGKSTLLRILAGLDANYQGKLQRDASISMVFQEPNLLPWRSVTQNLTLTTGIDESDVGKALAEVGLTGLQDRFPDQLSLGQQRRLALARAFAAKPDFLLMDEPFVSLDPERLSEMLNLTNQLLDSYQPGLILVTHSEVEAEQLCIRRLRLSGQPAMIEE